MQLIEARYHHHRYSRLLYGGAEVDTLLLRLDEPMQDDRQEEQSLESLV